MSRYQAKPLKHGDPDTVTCPHCWTVFPLEDALCVARHPDLLGDPILGPDAPSRFKPTRFTAEGNAIDPGGYVCLELACPNCHLEVPRSLADFRGVFFSIIGTVSSGKSYFLGTLAWELRRLLAEQFGISFTDIEAGMNVVLHSYEETLFFARDPAKFVSIKKTERQGELYNRVNIDGTEALLPKPFVFTMQPMAHHPDARQPGKVRRTLVLYDNAGEHFDPLNDTVRQPGTLHMAKSECLFFVFDPTQDPRFRARLKHVRDPQLSPAFRVQRQDVVFSEAARRIRRHVGLPHDRKYNRPVVVVVNKSDVWRELLKRPLRDEPIVREPTFPVAGLDVGHIEDVSLSVRHLLRQVSPEAVAAVEDFAERVTYIPVSTIGHSPTRNEQTGALEVRPADVRPHWVAVPFLYAFSKLGLIYRAHRPLPEGTPQATIEAKYGTTLHVRLPDGTAAEVPEMLMNRLLHHPETGEPFVVVPPQQLLSRPAMAGAAGAATASAAARAADGSGNGSAGGNGGNDGNGGGSNGGGAGGNAGGGGGTNG